MIFRVPLKISQIRTWTYIVNHHAWFINHTIGKKNTTEDELSDNLHDGLTKEALDSSSRHSTGALLDEKVEKVEIAK